MTTQLQLRRGTTAQNRVFTGAQGELTYDTELKQLRAHDGILNEQTGVMEGTQGGVVFDNSTTVVHKAGDEIITGYKIFNSSPALKNNLTPSTNTAKTEVIEDRLLSTSINTDGKIDGADIVRYQDTSGNREVRYRAGFRNSADTANKWPAVSIGVDPSDNEYVSLRGTYSYAPAPSTSNSKTANNIATIGWVNDYTKSTMVVHREGAETIAGAKTFSDGIIGTVSRSLWADLAENYVPDEEYPIGTLITFGGEKDITIARYNCNGVISEKPGFLLDHSLENSQPVALVGKTKVRVIGKVNKFDKLVLSSSVPGIAEVKRFENEKVIAIALESSEEDNEKLVMSVVKVNLD